jgi:hypothetical protein
MKFILARAEPTFDMWDQAENASMFAENAYAMKDRATLKDAHSFPTYRIWTGVVMYRAMLASQPALTDAEIDYICRMWFGEAGHWDRDIDRELAANETPSANFNVGRRNRDRARMRQFIAALGGK